VSSNLTSSATFPDLFLVIAGYHHLDVLLSILARPRLCLKVRNGKPIYNGTMLRENKSFQ